MQGGGGPAAVFVKLSEADFGRLEALGSERAEDAFFVHDEAVALVENVIFAQARGGEVHGDEICAGAKAATITEFRLADVQRADGGNDPVRTHEAHAGHAIKDEIDFAVLAVRKWRGFSRDERTDAAAGKREGVREAQGIEPVLRRFVWQAADETGADVPTIAREQADVVEAFFESTGSFEGVVVGAVRSFEF